MFFTFLGVIILVAGFVINNPSLTFAKFSGTVKAAGIFLILLGLLSTSIRQIDSGQVGVQTLFGKVQPGVLEGGLNVVNPLMNVTEFDTKTQNYTMSAVHDEGEKTGDDAISLLG